MGVLTMTAKKYLKTFFEEKQLEPEIFRIEHKSSLHFVESDFLIETILNSCEEEQVKIADLIRKIDFANGNINHYLKHLAKCYIATKY